MRLTAAVGVLPAAPAGPERLVTELLRAMTDLEPGLVLTLRATTLRRRADAMGAMRRISPDARFSVSRLPATLTAQMQRRLRAPSERLLSGAFDVYHQFHLDADPAVPSRRLVVGLNDLIALDWPDHEGRLGPHAVAALRRAARIVTLSAYSRDDAVARLGLDAARVTVISPGVDHRLFTPGPGPAGPPRLLFVGGGTPRKNAARVIGALHLLRQDPRSAGTRLVLAGPVARFERDLRAAAPAGLPFDALIFAGQVTDVGLADLYRNSHALLFPSLAEGFGLPVLEAMACGTPVVTSRRTSLPEVAGDAAVYVDPLDVASIAAGASSAIHEPQSDRSARRAAGIARAAGFTWASAARRTLDVYARLV